MKTKKNIIKISLIVVALVAAVLGVVLLQKILSPPTIKEFDNQYLADLKQRVRRLDTDDADKLVKEYNLQLDRIRLMKEKGLISEDDEQEKRTDVLDQYVKSFFQWCDRKFSNPQWDRADLDFMRRRIQDPNVSNYDSIKLVRDVLEAYDVVRTLPGKSIQSSQDCEKYLAIVKDYNGKVSISSRLKKCSDTKSIMENPNELKNIYHNTHRNYVNGLINYLDTRRKKRDKNGKLTDWKLTEIDTWYRKYQEAIPKRDDYCNYWSDCSSLSDLSIIYDKAGDYFLEKLYNLPYGSETYKAYNGTISRYFYN